ncbi:probable 4-coumarate--CoA ligase 3 isoform X2 [Anoplophora glabripennis]|uniref:probable 4-coumarate--CoA ligase 3 isoform X2 n=1 Tax=Anoplophora glabripennis TaxID=217634 RepID=UPI000873E7E9|nr:probable 4-coumarate--CoA ligase 3 isoform X2 [Anoplophora glabripennis]
MSIPVLTQRISFLTHVPTGLLSVFPISTIDKHHYTINFSELKVNRLLERKIVRTKRLLSEGIVKSPLGSCGKIPNQNLVEYVFKNIDKWTEEPAATCAVTGRSYTYGILRMLINRCAQALLGHCGMKPREVVGLLLPNIPEFIIVCHGAIEAGLTVTFVNPLYTPDEIKRQFENAGVKLIITVPILLEVANTISSNLQGYRSTICIGGEDDLSKNVHGLQSLLTGHESELPGINPRELALLPYSSGTTGLPKGVMLSHYNLVANLVQGNHPALIDPSAKDGAPHKILTVLPFFHIFGFNGIMNICLRDGSHLITIPRFTPEDYIKALITYRPTFLFVVPSLLLFLATHPAITAEHLSSVEGIQSGAAPLTEGLLQKFREKIDKPDVLIRQGYGMTESAPVTMCMPRLTPPSKIGTIGILYPETEAKIVSLTSGESLGTHQSGELLVRGPQLMMGYLNNEQATAETIDKDGWLHTGDVAYYDEDGYFYIVDRCKELIKVKGNQVSPTELENLILDIEGIIDAAVVGIPDSLAGEVPRAYIVRKPGVNINEDDIQRLVNSKVTHYKKLVGGVKFIESIPRNSSGKIIRNELKYSNY